MTRRCAAIAALTIFSLAVPAAHAAPGRSKATSSTAAKKKAAAAKAARNEAARLEAEAKAASAAAVAEAARMRAQWGLLADIGVGDFETSDGLPLTVRRSGETVEMTAWTSVARGRTAFERDPVTGQFTLSVPGQWSRKTFPARVEPDGTIEATMKNGARWTALSRDATGAYVFAGAPGGKMTFGPIRPYSKAADKIASLVAGGKVSAAGVPAISTPVVTAVAPVGASTVKTSWENKAVPLEVDRAIHYETSKKDKSDGFLWRVPCFRPQLEHGKTYIVTGSFGSQSGGLGLWRGCTSTSGAIASPDKYEPSDVRSIVFSRMSDEPVFIQVGMRGSGKTFDIILKEMSPEALAEWNKRKSEAKMAEARSKSQSGGAGMFGKMLGGALMGAMLGGGGQSSIDLAMAGAQAASGGGNTLDMLNAMGGVASAQAEQSKRELDATIARAEAQAAADRQRKRQEEAEENMRRVAAANDRQQAIADRTAAQRAATDATRGEQLALAEQERIARARTSEAEQQRGAAQARADADAQAEAERQGREAEEKAQADARRRAEAQKLAERQRREEEARRPVAFKEGVVICQQQGSRDYWRCDGPLQVTYAAFGQANWRTNIGQACGGGTINDFGTVSGYRAFGCGFGIHPSATMRDYPGNRDVPAALGLYIPDRGTFYCPTTASAYCRGR